MIARVGRKRRFPLLEGVLLLAGVIYVSPCLLALVNSFKTLPEIVRSPLALPRTLRFDNYEYVLTGIELLRAMRNSFLMCAAVIGCLITLAPMAAYSLTRRSMKTAPALRVLFLAGLTIPFQVILIPLLMEFRLLGIQNTYVALLLHYVSGGLPLCIFLYSGFMQTIPRELEEAAAIDGCRPFLTFWRIVFPLLTPCTVTIVIFWGLWIWNDFVQAFIIMGPSRGQLAFVQLWRFLSDKYVKNWNHIFAGVIVLSLPVTAVYLIMQRRLIRGIAAGAIK